MMATVEFNRRGVLPVNQCIAAKTLQQTIHLLQECAVTVRQVITANVKVIRLH